MAGLRRRWRSARIGLERGREASRYRPPNCSLAHPDGPLRRSLVTADRSSSTAIDKSWVCHGFLRSRPLECLLAVCLPFSRLDCAALTHSLDSRHCRNSMATVEATGSAPTRSAARYDRNETREHPPIIACVGRCLHRRRRATAHTPRFFFKGIPQWCGGLGKLDSLGAM